MRSRSARQELAFRGERDGARRCHRARRAGLSRLVVLRNAENWPTLSPERLSQPQKRPLVEVDGGARDRIVGVLGLHQRDGLAPPFSTVGVGPAGE
jgi:hypothetical protein